MKKVSQDPLRPVFREGDNFYLVKNIHISLEDYQEGLKYHKEQMEEDDSDSDYPSSHYWACKRYQKYIKISKILINRGIKYISPEVGVFLINDRNGRQFYYYPNTAQWRKKADGKSKPVRYKVKDINQLLDNYLFKEEVTK